MEDETLIRVRLSGGRYEGILTTGTPAGVEAVHEGSVVAVATLAADDLRPDTYRIAVDLPAHLIGEGVHVLNIRSAGSGAVLDRVTLMAGAELDEDIRAELALLRDELEMLKRAFRRHCAEAAGG